MVSSGNTRAQMSFHWSRSVEPLDFRRRSISCLAVKLSTPSSGSMSAGLRELFCRYS